METATDVLNPARQEALRNLLDDPSVVVRKALLAYFAEIGAGGAPFLRRLAQGSNRVLASQAAWYLNQLKFSDPISEFRDFIRSLNYELETGALLLARTVSPRLDTGKCCSTLDAITARCRELISEPSSSREKCRLINRVLFHEWGFRSCLDERVDPLNNLLDQVIARRKGTSLSLAIIYLLVAERLDLAMEPVTLPGGHCIVGCHVEAPPFFVDPFDQGLIRDPDEVLELLRGKRVNPKASDLAPAPVREVLCRLCRNLVVNYTAIGDPDHARLFVSFIEEFDAAYARNQVD